MRAASGATWEESALVGVDIHAPSEHQDLKLRTARGITLFGRSSLRSLENGTAQIKNKVTQL